MWVPIGRVEMFNFICTRNSSRFDNQLRLILVEREIAKMTLYSRVHFSVVWLSYTISKTVSKMVVERAVGKIAQR